MDTADLTSTEKSATMERTIITFAVSDPEALLALSDYPDGPARTRFLVVPRSLVQFVGENSQLFRMLDPGKGNHLDLSLWSFASRSSETDYANLQLQVMA